jgi:hypothetical protein
MFRTETVIKYFDVIFVDKAAALMEEVRMYENREAEVTQREEAKRKEIREVKIKLQEDLIRKAKKKVAALEIEVKQITEAPVDNSTVQWLVAYESAIKLLGVDLDEGVCSGWVFNRLDVKSVKLADGC